MSETSFDWDTFGDGGYDAAQGNDDLFSWTNFEFVPFENALPFSSIFVEETAQSWNSSPSYTFYRTSFDDDIEDYKSCSSSEEFFSCDSSESDDGDEEYHNAISQTRRIQMKFQRFAVKVDVTVIKEGGGTKIEVKSEKSRKYQTSDKSCGTQNELIYAAENNGTYYAQDLSLQCNGQNERKNRVQEMIQSFEQFNANKCVEKSSSSSTLSSVSSSVCDDHVLRKLFDPWESSVNFVHKNYCLVALSENDDDIAEVEDPHFIVYGPQNYDDDEFELKDDYFDDPYVTYKSRYAKQQAIKRSENNEQCFERSIPQRCDAYPLCSTVQEPVKISDVQNSITTSNWKDDGHIFNSERGTVKTLNGFRETASPNEPGETNQAFDRSYIDGCSYGMKRNNADQTDYEKITPNNQKPQELNWQLTSQNSKGTTLTENLSTSGEDTKWSTPKTHSLLEKEARSNDYITCSSSSDVFPEDVSAMDNSEVGVWSSLCKTWSETKHLIDVDSGTSSQNESNTGSNYSTDEEDLCNAIRSLCFEDNSLIRENNNTDTQLMLRSKEPNRTNASTVRENSNGEIHEEGANEISQMTKPRKSSETHYYGDDEESDQYSDGHVPDVNVTQPVSNGNETDDKLDFYQVLCQKTTSTSNENISSGNNSWLQIEDSGGSESVYGPARSDSSFEQYSYKNCKSMKTCLKTDFQKSNSKRVSFSDLTLFDSHITSADDKFAENLQTLLAELEVCGRKSRRYRMLFQRVKEIIEKRIKTLECSSKGKEVRRELYKSIFPGVRTKTLKGSNSLEKVQKYLKNCKLDTDRIRRMMFLIALQKLFKSISLKHKDKCRKHKRTNSVIRQSCHKTKDDFFLDMSKSPEKADKNTHIIHCNDFVNARDMVVGRKPMGLKYNLGMYRAEEDFSVNSIIPDAKETEAFENTDGIHSYVQFNTEQQENLPDSSCLLSSEGEDENFCQDCDGTAHDVGQIPNEPYQESIMQSNEITQQNINDNIESLQETNQVGSYENLGTSTRNNPKRSTQYQNGDTTRADKNGVSRTFANDKIDVQSSLIQKQSNERTSNQVFNEVPPESSSWSSEESASFEDCVDEFQSTLQSNEDRNDQSKYEKAREKMKQDENSFLVLENDIKSFSRRLSKHEENIEISSKMENKHNQSQLMNLEESDGSEDLREGAISSGGNSWVRIYQPTTGESENEHVGCSINSSDHNMSKIGNPTAVEQHDKLYPRVAFGINTSVSNYNAFKTKLYSSTNRGSEDKFDTGNLVVIDNDVTDDRSNLRMNDSKYHESTPALDTKGSSAEVIRDDSNANLRNLLRFSSENETDTRFTWGQKPDVRSTVSVSRPISDDLETRNAQEPSAGVTFDQSRATVSSATPCEFGSNLDTKSGSSAELPRIDSRSEMYETMGAESGNEIGTRDAMTYTSIVADNRSNLTHYKPMDSDKERETMVSHKEVTCNAPLARIYRSASNEQVNKIDARGTMVYFARGSKTKPRTIPTNLENIQNVGSGGIQNVAILDDHSKARSLKSHNKLMINRHTMVTSDNVKSDKTKSRLSNTSNHDLMMRNDMQEIKVKKTIEMPDDYEMFGVTTPSKDLSFDRLAESISQASGAKCHVFCDKSFDSLADRIEKNQSDQSLHSQGEANTICEDDQWKLNHEKRLHESLERVGPLSERCAVLSNPKTFEKKTNNPSYENLGISVVNLSKKYTNYNTDASPEANEVRSYQNMRIDVNSLANRYASNKKDMAPKADKVRSFQNLGINVGEIASQYTPYQIDKIKIQKSEKVPSYQNMGIDVTDISKRYTQYNIESIKQRTRKDGSYQNLGISVNTLAQRYRAPNHDIRGNYTKVGDGMRGAQGNGLHQCYKNDKYAESADSDSDWEIEEEAMKSRYFDTEREILLDEGRRGMAQSQKQKLISNEPRAFVCKNEEGNNFVVDRVKLRHDINRFKGKKVDSLITAFNSVADEVKTFLPDANQKGSKSEKVVSSPRGCST